MYEACDGTPLVFTFSNQTDITSPNYPLHYDTDLNCTWIIISEEDKRIKLSLQPDGNGELEEQ